MRSDNGETHCVPSWDKTSDEQLSLVFIVLYFVAIGSFTVDGGLLQPTECVKTTPQKTRLRDVKYARFWDTD